MKYFILLLTLMFTSLSAQAQFSQAIGISDNDFQASQIRTLNGNTYVSGWVLDPTAISPALTAEGMVVCMNPSGAIDWIYQLSSNTPLGVVDGTRIFDFDFDDNGANIVFVGATTPRNGNMLDNESILGMIDINTGTSVFQQTYEVRDTARESFQRIANNPSNDVLDANTYIISGLVNTGGVGLIDNYLTARVEITPNLVNFNWINESTYTGNNADDEMHRMRILDVNGDLQIVHAGTTIPGRDARINFHDINSGNVLDQIFFNLPGTVLDVGQIGNTMIVVGRLRGPFRAFIASIDLATLTVTSDIEINGINNFSRLAIDPNTGDIFVVGERNGALSTICSFDLVGNQLNYLGAIELDFGNDELGDGVLAVEGNEAYFADTRSMLTNVGMNNSAAVFRTNFDFVTCNTGDLNFTNQPANLSLSDDTTLVTTPLGIPNPNNLALEQDTFCTISLCGSGFNLNTLIPVFHSSRSHYVKVADIDNDGWNDFAVPDILFSGTPRFNVSMNNQNSNFTSTPSTSNIPVLGGDAESMEFIDLDGGAGNLDVVLQRQGRIEILIDGSGAGNYTIEQFIDVTFATPPSTTNILGLFRSNFDFVDHNNDNFVDLVVTGPSTGSGSEDRIAIFFGTGNTTTPFFSTVADVLFEGLSAISYWESVHADIDMSNGNDLLLGQAGFNAGQQSVFGYLNTGSQTTPFTPLPNLNYETPLGLFWPRGMEMRNIDANGQLDLVVAMQGNALNGGQVVGEGAVIIARDAPVVNGTYTAANLQWETLNIPGAPVGIAFGDIDSDGDDDLAVAVHSGTGSLSSFVRVYENNGNGNFFSFMDISTPIGQTVELEIADFNNDCCLDIVTTQWTGAMSYVLINNCQVTEFTIEGRVVCENDPCNFLFPANGVPNQTVEITDGTNIFYAITNALGEYEVDVPAGVYDIGVANVTYGDATCINANTADVIGLQSATNLNMVNFFIENQCELDVNLVGGISGFVGDNTCPFVATPCDSLIWEYCFEIENNTCTDQVIDEITINLPNGIDINNVTISPLFECSSQTQVGPNASTIGVYAGPPPFIFGSTVVYNLNASLTILSGECFSGCVEATFIGGFTLPVTAVIDVDYSCGDDAGLPATSGVAYQDTCSCDPNLKLAYFPQNCGTLDELLDQPIEYTIQFTNIGQTAAYDILVLDQLDNNLDLSTFQWQGSSHPTTSINVSNGLLEVFFNNINLAPGGVGWLRFSVKPSGTTTNNTTISNYADIIFDNNAPVSTNITETTIQASSASADLQFNATEFCVGDEIVIDYTWSGDEAWLNYTQDGVPLGQNVIAPSSGTQITFVIPDDSYVGLWEYELIAYDSITGCIDTASALIQIYDCDCDLDDQIFMGIGNGSYEFYSQAFNSALNPGFDIIEFQWQLGDGTASNDQSPIHQYNCKKLGPHTVEVCLYYLAEINGRFCEGEICQTFEVCQKGNSFKANIYPNPANNAVTIQSEVFLNQTAELTVEAYSVDGKLLKTYQLEPESDRINLKLIDTYKGLVYIRILNSLGEVLLEDRFLKLNHTSH